MRMIKKSYFILITAVVLFIVGMTGCKSAKTVTGDAGEGVIEAAALVQELAESYKPWNTYSVSGKLSLSGKSSFSTSIQLKLVKDKCLIMSIRPVLGIEMAKVFIDNDSAVVINKYNKVYTSMGLDIFSHVVPMNISALQDIFLSRVFSLNDGTLSSDNIKKFGVTIEENSVLIAPRKKPKDFSYMFAVNRNRQLEALSIQPSGSGKSYTAEYGGYNSDAGGEASMIKLNTSIKGVAVSIGLNLNTSRAKWGAPVDEKLSINKSYKKVTLEEFFAILKSL